MDQCTNFVTGRKVYLIIIYCTLYYMSFVSFLSQSWRFHLKKSYFTELGDDVPMVECTGANCPGNNWFHILVYCVIGSDGDFEQSEDFACSEECRSIYKYCCGLDLGKHEPMIGCDNTACLLEWFHMKCVGLKTAPRKNINTK